MLVCFVSGENLCTHVLTLWQCSWEICDNWQNMLQTITELAINYFLWSSVSAEGTQCIHTVLNLKSWMILMIVPYDRVRRCCNSLTVILMLSQIWFFACARLSGALLLWISYSLYNPLCYLFHLRISHTILLYSAAHSFLAFENITAQTSFLDHCSSQGIMFDWLVHKVLVRDGSTYTVTSSD